MWFILEYFRGITKLHNLLVDVNGLFFRSDSFNAFWETSFVLFFGLKGKFYAVISYAI